MTKAKKTSSVKYSLNSKGYFVIEDYNRAKAFSSFFPGVAGLWGIPMWVFYVNRGQCIASFGIESKDKSIMEFQPANKSYRLTSLQGFRTFIKVKQGRKEFYWEPFQNNLTGTDYKKKQTMYICAHDLILEEKNLDLGLTVKIHYFTVPEEPYSALVRRITIQNNDKKSSRIEILDGMPAILPYGQKDWLAKHLSRTVEAWVRVRNLDNLAPFYQFKVEVADTPQVTHIREGNFFFSFDTDAPENTFLPPTVETGNIFGPNLDFLSPQRFIDGTFDPHQEQTTSNKSPCAFGYHSFELKPSKEKKIVGVYGYARDVDQLNQLTLQMTKDSFVYAKDRQNKKIIDDIKRYALTNSSSENFNLYSSYTFLDNILRGGLPISIKTGEGNVVFNVYSRKHGDLERDYNHFTVAPTFYSQGNGNFRDVNQNRRNDVWFNTDVKDSHIINFLNLSQADGYNPLVVKGTSFVVKTKEEARKIVDQFVQKGDKKKLEEFLLTNFLPGELLYFIDHHDIVLKENIRDFLGGVLEECRIQELADHGEGFWSDHWSYNLDLIESYLSLYPEERENLLIKKKVFYFYLNHHFVRPRDQRYHITKFGIRQYESVCDDSENFDPGMYGFKLREKQGEGAVYSTNLICKLLCFIANKIASLDPSGIGVEMEADKPNWYDALNGLPGLTGSAISETLELKRYSQFILDSFNILALEGKDRLPIFEELATFISGLTNILTVKQKGIEYWNKANDIKENYRLRVRRAIDGKEVKMSINEIRNFLNLVVEKTAEAAELARNEDGLLATYFFHEVTDYKKLDKKQDNNHGLVKPLAFKKHALPLFLEGYVHALKVQEKVADARKLFGEVCQSDLYDKKLKMFKVNTDLSKQTEEIGRTRIFPSGWLENESIWLHMEYKFMLEILRAQLHEEFYDIFKNVMVPFLKPAQYGRSILENSSFIVSSAHEDKELHGQGFVARLSGSTAEYLHIWLHMNAGPNPFVLNAKGELNLSFKPTLAKWLFTTKESTIEFMGGKDNEISWKLPKRTYAFKFLNSTLIVYHNPDLLDTFGKNRANIKKIEITFKDTIKPVTINAPTIPSPYALQIRNQQALRIDIHLA